MAKNTAKTRVTKRTVIEETAPQGGEPGADELDVEAGNGGDAAPDPDELDGIAKLRALAGGESLARFEVRRVMPAAEAGYVGTLGDEELTMERLADEFGPGTYTIRVRLPGGKFAGSDRVQIAGLPKHRQPSAAPVASAPQGGDNATALIMQAMQRSTESQINMLSGMVKSLIERPLPTPPAPPPPPDTIQILTLASKLFDKGDKGGDPFTQFLKGVEFGKELGGGGDDMADVLLKGIDGLKDLSAAAPAQPRRRMPPPGTVPAIEGPAAAPAAQVQPTEAQRAPGATMNPMQLLGWLNKQVQHLLVQASRRKSPELYAEVFLDNLPDGLDDAAILARLKAPDAIEQLARLDKRVLSFRTWFEEFRDACVELLEAGPDDEDDDGEDDETGSPDDIQPEFPGGGEGGQDA